MTDHGDALSTAAGLSAFEWPQSQAVAAVGALARAAGLAVPTRYAGRAGDAGALVVGAGAVVTLPAGEGLAPAESARASTLDEAIGAAAEGLALDAEPIDVAAADPLLSVRQSAPMLLRLPGAAGVLAIVRARGARVTLVGPRGAAGFPCEVLEATLSAEPTAAALAAALAGLADAPAAARRRQAARLMMAPLLRDRPAAAGWIIRAPSTGIAADLRGAKIYRRVAGVVVAYVLQFALFVAIWREVGTRSFAAGISAAAPSAPPGAAAAGWATFFALLATWVLVQLWASWAVSRLALDIGQVVRAGLLRGALRLDTSRMRAAGVGQLLGRALEADALDALALGGGVETLVGLFELTVGCAVLALGVAPGWSCLMLGAAVVAMGLFGRVHARRLRLWNDNRRGLTHELVERMVGHRTVLIQDRPAARGRADDAALRSYDGVTRALDSVEVWGGVLLPRAWLFAGLLVLAPVVLRGAADMGAGLALSVAGVWLAYGAFRRLGLALPMLSQAREAWRQLAPLMRTMEGAGLPARPAPPARAPAVVADDPGMTSALLQLDQVSYQYPGRAAPALNGVTVTVRAQDRVLVEGASGGGKSTLAALLTGLKSPTAGALWLRGREQTSLGLTRWRRAIGGAPQFHDNHVFGTTLMFNLLMGRRWPPRHEDLVDAERVCRDLGLGPLLDRMPGGLQQQVGETGWQLSHGERSRLFVARSLLQELDARVLDESFAALDPRTLDQVLAAVLKRPEALIVIAHP